MTSEEYEKTKEMLTAWANYNYYVRQQKYEIDETIKLCKALEKNKEQVECYIDDDIKETNNKALEYCKNRIKKLDVMIRQTSCFKKIMDDILDELSILDKNIVVARYVKKQEWTHIANLWPCSISSRQIQRMHKSILEEIWKKYSKIK